MSQVLHGTAVGSGVVIGPAIIQGNAQRIVRRYNLAAGQVEAEQDRLKQAFADVEAHLEGMKKRLKVLPNRDPYLILEVHQSLLMDDSFYKSTLARISKQSINAEWALEQSVNEIRKVFAKVEDTYFRSRLDDVLNLYDLLLQQLDGTPSGLVNGHETMLDQAVLVAQDISPHAALQAIRSGVRAIVLEGGTPTDHAAIIARSMGIPMMIQVPTLLHSVNPGQQIAVDAESCQVVLSPSADRVRRIEERFEALDADQGVRWNRAAGAAVTRDGTPVAILANVDLPEELGPLKIQAVNGVGLFRTEIPYLGQDVPDEESLIEAYKAMFAVSDEKEIVFRLLDLGGDKLPFGALRTDELESPLGLRGIRFLFAHPQIMRAQIRAIGKASAGRSVNILLPMIVSQREVRRAKAIIHESMESVGVPLRNVKIGCMVETPGAALVADQLAKVSDFLSVGTNDLTQFTLVADRNGSYAKEYYDPYHPAIVRILAGVFRSSKDVPVTLCGELAGDPHFVPLLLGMGARSLSISLPSVPDVKSYIRTLNIRECRSLFRACLKADSSAALEALLHVFLKKHPVP